MSAVEDVAKKEFLTPPRLRIILVASLFLMALIMAGIFSVAQNILRDQATAVSTASAKAQSSANLIQSLSNTQQKLAKNQSAIDRASAIVAESKQYQYQNQIINDLTQFATNNGVTILNIDFPATTSGAATGSTNATTSTPPPTSATPGAASTPAASTIPTGVKSISTSITIKSPVNYQSFLNFVNAIQNNLTKMQVSSLSLTSSQDGVSSETLTVQVYVR